MEKVSEFSKRNLICSIRLANISCIVLPAVSELIKGFSINDDHSCLTSFPAVQIYDLSYILSCIHIITDFWRTLSDHHTFN